MSHFVRGSKSRARRGPVRRAYSAEAAASTLRSGSAAAAEDGSAAKAGSLGEGGSVGLLPTAANRLTSKKCRMQNDESRMKRRAPGASPFFILHSLFCISRPGRII